MHEPLNSMDDIKKACKQAEIDFSFLSSFIGEYKQFIPTIKKVEPRLLHHDFGIDHIFVKNNTISGVIDFGDSGSGDPVLDIVRWTYFTKPKFPLEAVIEGYEKVRLIRDLYEKRKRFYLIHLNLQQF